MRGSLQAFLSLFAAAGIPRQAEMMPDFFWATGGAKDGAFFATRGSAKREQRAAQKRKNLRMRKG